MQRKINGKVLELLPGDITEMETAAIVNAANSYLKHGGGVAGAIVRKGGRVIQEESDRIGRCPVGQAVITSAGSLKASYVIHAVGPRIGEGNEDEKLGRATLSSLQLADRHHLQSIAFPAISTGIFGYPVERCAQIMLATTIKYLESDTGLDRVVFCLFGQQNLAVFEQELELQLPTS
ncbi:MAG: macro domain-containing protein [Thermacetogeniaceae bacterium]